MSKTFDKNLKIFKEWINEWKRDQILLKYDNLQKKYKFFFKFYNKKWLFAK